MSGCRPSCGVAMLVVGGAMATGDIGREVTGALAMSWAMWVWIAILIVVLVLSMFTVTPASQDTGEPPP